MKAKSLKPEREEPMVSTVIVWTFLVLYSLKVKNSATLPVYCFVFFLIFGMRRVYCQGSGNEVCVPRVWEWGICTEGLGIRYLYRGSGNEVSIPSVLEWGICTEGLGMILSMHITQPLHIQVHCPDQRVKIRLTHCAIGCTIAYHALWTTDLQAGVWLA